MVDCEKNPLLFSLFVFSVTLSPFFLPFLSYFLPRKEMVKILTMLAIKKGQGIFINGLKV